MIHLFEIAIADLGGCLMLKLVSRFVLEVLPYVLSALIAAIVVPGFLISQFQGDRLARATIAVEWKLHSEAIVADQGISMVPLTLDSTIQTAK
jgi:hypothetical protein